LNSFFSVVTCPPPPVATNGRLSNNPAYEYGVTAEYQCNSGFRFAAGSPSSLTCDENGSWGQAPSCEGRSMRLYYPRHFKCNHGLHLR